MAKIEYDATELQALAAALGPYLPTSPVDPGNPPGGNTPPPIKPPPVITPPPIVPPPVQGVAISARWDSAPSQWAKWNFVTPAEQNALINLYGQTAVMQHVNWWHSYHTLNGVYDEAKKVYRFVADTTWWGSPVWADDVNGAADAKHLADLNGTPEIAPLG